MAKKKPKKPKGWWVRERIAKAQLAKAQEAEQQRQYRVYGRVNEIPPDEPSESVRALSTSFESGRRRH